MSENKKTRTITIASGKGGVGKTNLTVNLALCLSARGHRTCLFDADLGLGNVNILLGLHPELDLEDVIINHRDIQDIIISNYHGIDIIPGSSGIEKIANLDNHELGRLVGSLSGLKDYDFLLLDTSAGISRNVIAFCLASSEVILLINPEPTSLTDAYSLLKILTLNGFNGTARVVVNQIKNVDIAKGIYQKFKDALKKHLQLDISLLGVIFQDSRVVEAVKSQQPFVANFPDSNASKCIKHIAQSLIENQPLDTKDLEITSFWKKALQVFKSPLSMTIQQKEGSQTPAKPSQDVPKQVGKENISAISPKVGDSSPMSMEGSPVIGELVKGISSVSQELQLIRKLLEDMDLNSPDIKGTAAHLAQAQAANRIILDFDAFQKRHNTKTDKEKSEE